MYLDKIRKTYPRAISERALFNRMRLAIEHIEAVYSPTLSFGGNADVRRRELDRMELCSLETIAAWEAGWLKLIDELNRKQAVSRANNFTPKKAWPHVG